MQREKTLEKNSKVETVRKCERQKNRLTEAHSWTLTERDTQREMLINGGREGSTGKERGSDGNRGTHRNATKDTQAGVLGPPPSTGTSDSGCCSRHPFRIGTRASVCEITREVETLP